MIRLVQPPARRPESTGGYRYNAEVARGLLAMGAGKLVEVAPTDLAAWWSGLRAGASGDVAVFDSLYLTRYGPPEGLALDERTRLLLHYLPSEGAGAVAERRRLQTVEASWIRTAGGVITSSRRLAARVSRRYGVPAQAARPGVEPFFRPAPRPGPAHRAGPITVLAVGSLVPGKGQAEIAEALANLPAPHRVRLQLVGDAEAEPSYTEAVRRAAAGIGLELCGCLPPREVAERLRRADLFASASSRESYGMAVAEAVATGVPVLAYRTGEIDEWVADGGNGFLIATGDRAGYRERLHALCEDPSRLAAMRASRRRPRFPTWQETCHLFHAACLGLVRNARSSR